MSVSHDGLFRLLELSRPIKFLYLETWKFKFRVKSTNNYYLPPEKRLINTCRPGHVTLALRDVVESGAVWLMMDLDFIVMFKTGRRGAATYIIILFLRQ